MLVRLSGQLTDVGDESVVIEREGMAYEVHVPRYTLGELLASRGRQVTLHTLQYLEGNPTGGNLTPRLVGFLHVEDRAFFQMFTTVKGVGVRKGLRALAEPIVRVARDIESADIKGLSRLPGVGARLAQQIIAELRGKATPFTRGAGAGATPDVGMTPAQRDALELMVALGDGRADAQRWLERAAQLHPELADVQDWVRAAYRVRSGAEG